MRLQAACIFALTVICGGQRAAAATFDCGKPPPLADESARLELGASAQALTKSLGGEVHGVADRKRTEVLSKYPNADRALADAFLNYEVCSIVMNDASLSSEKKVHMLTEARRAFATPVTAIKTRPAMPVHRLAPSAPPQKAAQVPPVALNVVGGSTVVGNVGVFNAGTVPLARRQYLPKLQEFFARGELIYSASRSDNLTDAEVDLRLAELDAWVSEASTWMATNMTVAAANKFKHWQKVFGVQYELQGTHSEAENRKFAFLNVVTPQLLQNLQFLMTSDSMDRSSEASH